VLVTTAAPAGAHAELTEKNVPGGIVRNLTMHAPNEEDTSNTTVWNVSVSIAVPAGFEVRGCSAPGGWTCSTAPQGGGTAVRFVKANPAAAPANDRAEQDFDIEVRTPAAPGSYPFATVQTYSNGYVAHWTGGPGDQSPASVLAVLAGGASAPPPAAPAAGDHGKAPAGAPTTKPALPGAVGEAGDPAAADTAADQPVTTVDPKAGGSIVIPRGAAPTFKPEQVAPDVAQSAALPTSGSSTGSAVTFVGAAILAGFLLALGLAVVIAACAVLAAILAMRETRPPKA
jgi:hypothetical protein